jgi:thiol-disulfide isomerase/thioredoxin
MKYLFLIPSFLLLNLATTAQGFVIEGKCNEVNHGTVFLEYQPQKSVFIKDSSIIRNGKFSFEGTIAEPKQAIVSYKSKWHPNSETNATAIYLEPHNLLLQIHINRNQKIIYRLTGSQTQKDYEWLTAKKAAIAQISNGSKISSVEKSFVQLHTNSIISAITIALNFQTWSLDTIRQLYQKLTPFVKQSEYGRLVEKFVRDEINSSPGKTARIFFAKDFNGSLFSLDAFKGRYILLDFWASWCAPCRAAFPYLREQYKKYNEKGFDIIGISEDANEADWRKAVESDSIFIWNNILSGFSIENYGTSLDTARISGKYGVHYFPTKILIDRNGIIMARWAGESEANTQAIKKILSALFD